MFFTIGQQSVQTLLNGGQKKEGFNSNDNYYLSMLIVLVLWLAILLLVSKFIWNEVLVELVTVVKPATSVIQILGLVILLEIMIPK